MTSRGILMSTLAIAWPFLVTAIGSRSTCSVDVEEMPAPETAVALLQRRSKFEQRAQVERVDDKERSKKLKLVTESDQKDAEKIASQQVADIKAKGTKEAERKDEASRQSEESNKRQHAVAGQARAELLNATETEKSTPMLLSSKDAAEEAMENENAEHNSQLKEATAAEAANQVGGNQEDLKTNKPRKKHVAEVHEESEAAKRNETIRLKDRTMEEHAMDKETAGSAKRAAAETAKALANDYMPGVSGKAFATPTPGMRMANAYLNINMVCIVAGFVLCGVVIVLTWMNCKACCESLHIFRKERAVQDAPLFPRASQAQTEQCVALAF